MSRRTKMKNYPSTQKPEQSSLLENTWIQLLIGGGLVAALIYIVARMIANEEAIEEMFEPSLASGLTERDVLLQHHFFPKCPPPHSILLEEYEYTLDPSYLVSDKAQNKPQLMDIAQTDKYIKELAESRKKKAESFKSWERETAYINFFNQNHNCYNAVSAINNYIRYLDASQFNQKDPTAYTALAHKQMLLSGRMLKSGVIEASVGEMRKALQNTQTATQLAPNLEAAEASRCNEIFVKKRLLELYKRIRAPFKLKHSLKNEIKNTENSLDCEESFNMSMNMHVLSSKIVEEAHKEVNENKFGNSKLLG